MRQEDEGNNAMLDPSPLRKQVPGHLLQFEEKIFGMTLTQLMTIMGTGFVSVTLTAVLPLLPRIAVCTFVILVTLVLVLIKINDEPLFSWILLLFRAFFIPTVAIWRLANTPGDKGEPPSIQDAWLPITDLDHGLLGQISTRKGNQTPNSTFWAVLQIESQQQVRFLAEAEQVRLYNRFKTFLDGLGTDEGVGIPVKFLTLVEPIDRERDPALEAQRVALQEIPTSSPLHHLQHATIKTQEASHSTNMRHFLIVSVSSREIARRNREGDAATGFFRLLRLFVPGRQPNIPPEQVKRELVMRLSVVRKALQQLDVQVKQLDDPDLLATFASCLAPGASIPSFHVDVLGAETPKEQPETTQKPSAEGEHPPTSSHQPVLDHLTNARQRRWKKRINGLHQGAIWSAPNQQPRLSKKGPRLADLLAPSAVTLLRNAVEVDLHEKKRYARYYEARGFAAELDCGWVEELTDLALPMVIMTRIESIASRLMIRKLELDLTKLESERLSNDQSHRILKSAHKVEAEQARSIMDRLERKHIRVFSTQMLIGIHAGSIEHLEERATYLLSHLRDIQLRARALTRRHDLGWQACLPGELSWLDHSINLPSDVLSTFMHWSSGMIGTPTGVYLGTTGSGLSRRPVYLNPWDPYKRLPNPHVVICGESGMGKSWLVKMIILGLLCNRIADAVVLDKDGDYDAIHTFLGQASQRFNLSGSIPLNLLTLPYGPEDVDRTERVDLLAEFIENYALIGLALLYREEFSQAQEAFLSVALRETFARKGITTEAIWKNPQTLLHKPPVFSDLIAVMKEIPAATEALRHSLVERFEHVTYLFHEQEEIAIDTPLTIFNIQRLDEKWYPLVTYVIQTYLMRHRALRRDERYLAYVIEEASFLLRHPAGKRYLESGSRGFRKLGIAQFVVSQHPADFLEEGQIILANSATNVFLGMQRHTARKLHLAEELEQVLEDAVPGRAVMRCGREYAALDISQGSSLHHTILTTDPVEQKALRQRKNHQHQARAS
jgi:hypothetical protein